MCINSILQVKKLTGTLAIMSDGRKVHVGSNHTISVGDYLEVYADLAIDKVDEADVKGINTVRLKGSAS